MVSKHASRNEHTGAKMQTGVMTDAYADNHTRIFGKPRFRGVINPSVIAPEYVDAFAAFMVGKQMAPNGFYGSDYQQFLDELTNES